MDYVAIWTFAFPYLIIFAVFYLFLIVPQKRSQKRIQEMLSALKTGDKVITIGGIVGVISEIKDDELLIETGTEKTKMKIVRWAVKNVQNNEEK